jgi:hypothetical protein
MKYSCKHLTGLGDLSHNRHAKDFLVILQVQKSGLPCPSHKHEAEGIVTWDPGQEA